MVQTEHSALPATLRLGPVHLTVSDLARSIAWYERALGLQAGPREDGQVELGDGTTASVVLHEDVAAGAAGRHAGLYHYALLFPTRKELARAALRLVATRTPIQGMSDHGTHEAIYLPDPDGNGIELAADRPREQWPRHPYGGGPAPLDVDALLEGVRGETPRRALAAGLRVGHMHLHIGDIDEALAFYCDLLGFELQFNLGTAAFVSAGGYHHHLGVNVWKGRGVSPPPPHTAGLHHWTVELPPLDVAAVRARVERAGHRTEHMSDGFCVRDPWQLAVAFVGA